MKTTRRDFIKNTLIFGGSLVLSPFPAHSSDQKDLPWSPAYEKLEKEGSDLERVIICHIDRTIFDRAKLSELASTGVVLEYDLFGHEHSHYPFNLDIDQPNDAERPARQLEADELLLACFHCLVKGVALLIEVPHVVFGGAEIPRPEQEPKQRLHTTVNALNRNQKNHLIRFRGDGRGEGIRWELHAPGGNGDDSTASNA